MAWWKEGAGGCRRVCEGGCSTEVCCCMCTDVVGHTRIGASKRIRARAAHTADK